MKIVPPSIDLVKVGYISKTEGYTPGLTIAEAEEHEKSYPGTTYIFVDADANIRYLTIEQVKQLTTASLERTPFCDIGPKPCGPPTIIFIGGGGIGAKANPIVDRNGNLLAVDIVNGGYGYRTPPTIKVIDPCNNGSGAVLRPRMKNGRVDDVIVLDSGTGYLPPSQTVPQYPARICIKEILVTNPGLNYNCGVDELVVTPSNGAKLTYECDSFGRIKSVTIVSKGCYSELPTISMRSNTGVNASFAPLYSITRDPDTPEQPDQTAGGVVQVFDLVGLTLQGYVDGTEYYGNVAFENGIKYAGTRNTGVRVYETRAQSIGAAPVETTTLPDTDVTDTFVPQTTSGTTAAPTVDNTSTASPAPTTTTTTTTVAPAATPPPPPPPPPPPAAPPPPSSPSYGGY